MITLATPIERVTIDRLVFVRPPRGLMDGDELSAAVEVQDAKGTRVYRQDISITDGQCTGVEQVPGEMTEAAFRPLTINLPSAFSECVKVASGAKDDAGKLVALTRHIQALGLLPAGELDGGSDEAARFPKPQQIDDIAVDAEPAPGIQPHPMPVVP